MELFTLVPPRKAEKSQAVSSILPAQSSAWSNVLLLVGCKSEKGSPGTLADSDVRRR